MDQLIERLERWRRGQLCEIATAIIGAGVGSAVGGVASAVIGGNAAQSAAQTQLQAATQAQQLQQNMFGTTQQNLAPFIAAGTGAQTQLQNLTGSGIGGNPLTAPLTQPFAASPYGEQTALQQTPGYQFTLNQGLQATQNSYAAQGLGSSGAALKGAANYAEGLAGTTFQQQYTNYLAQNQQIYNMLAGQAQTGLSGAAALGGVSVQAAGQIGNTLTSGAAAEAAGQIGSANALNSGISSITGAGTNTALLLGLNNAGVFGAGGVPAANNTALQASSGGGFFPTDTSGNLVF